MTWTQALAVAAGGAIGAVLRWMIASWAGRSALAGQLPWGTLAVNVAGTALLAWLFVASQAGRGLSEQGMLLWGTGLCGALTTFSTFAVEALLLVRAGAYVAAGSYLALNLVLCLAIGAVIVATLKT